MLSSFCSPLNSIPNIPGIISVVTAGIISVVIGGHLGGGDHFDGGDHFGGGTELLLPSRVSLARLVLSCAHYFHVPATQATISSLLRRGFEQHTYYDRHQ